LLDWLESTYAARLVQESIWGYPIVLSGHAVGMAILVGIVLMINFRVLGFASGVPMVAMRPMLRFAMIGLVINVISGTMLFMANANSFFESNPFRVKIVLLIVGAILLAVMPARLFDERGTVRAHSFDTWSKVLATVAILVWLGVMVAGRLIAYLDLGFY
jgi:Co/Zn/Cd efflux system component